MRFVQYIVVLFFGLIFQGQLALGVSSSVLGKMPVQDGGRIKPFESFARESLQLIHGRQTYKKKSAVDVVFTWMMVPEHWADEAFVQIRDAKVREALGFNEDRVYYSPAEILENQKVGVLFQELKSAQKASNKLSSFYQAVQTLENQINLYHGIRMGYFLRVAPQEGTDGWLPVRDLKGEEADLFAQIMKSFVKFVGTENKKDATSAEKESRMAEFDGAVTAFTKKMREKYPEKYGSLGQLNAELYLIKHRPFLWTWIFYLLTTIFVVAAWVSNKSLWYKLGWAAGIIGFILHNYGFGLRVYITERGPVTNMYEIVLWTAYGTMVFAFILEAIYKSKIILASAGFAATFFMILSDLAPAVLDPSLRPLQPVLRDNFWLLTHVLIISISYSAFFLSFAIGDLLLFYYIKDEQRFHQQIKDGVKAIYRSIQAGTVLLAAGTILGGVWADYSWGRFWGWDPKETWALITLLGYLAILHGRLAGLIKDFGMVVWSIVTFALVIMAAYGVNYVLGAGLHSYGFGVGGVEYVAGFIAIHILYVAYGFTVRRSQLADASSKK